MRIFVFTLRDVLFNNRLKIEPGYEFCTENFEIKALTGLWSIAISLLVKDKHRSRHKVTLFSLYVINKTQISIS